MCLEKGGGVEEDEGGSAGVISVFLVSSNMSLLHTRATHCHSRIAVLVFPFLLMSQSELARQSDILSICGI